MLTGSPIGPALKICLSAVERLAQVCQRFCYLFLYGTHRNSLQVRDLGVRQTFEAALHGDVARALREIVQGLDQSRK
jgi:hypothetical protein